MLFLFRKLRYATLVGALVFLASCGGGGGGGGSTGVVGLPDDPGQDTGSNETGTVTVLATDLDTDLFSAINLTITRAELLGAAGSEVLFEGEKTFDLLALANVTEVFSVAEVPAGTYSKIRLTLTQIELVFHDGRPPEYPKLPGNGKLDINPQGDLYVDADNPLTIELDFDAEKSLHIVEKGNGGFNFRPVVLTKQVQSEFDTKLIRQTGIVHNLNVEAGSFDLCLVSDEADCVGVVVAADGTSIFSATGEAIGVGDLVDGAVATVVGRLYASDDVVAAAAGSTLKRLGASSGVSALEDAPLCEEVEGQLICDGKQCEPFEGELLCDGNLFCNDIEGEFVCEEIELEEPLCEEIEGQLVCGDMVCELDDGQLICDDALICDDIEGELVCEEIEDPDDGCFEYEGELVCDEDCHAVEGELVCDDDDSSDDDSSEDDISEDDPSEDDQSEDDISEDDESEDDTSQDDESEDDISNDDDASDDDDLSEDDDASEDEQEPGNDDARVVLLADIIWLGDDFSRTENVACGPVNKDDSLGTWYRNAELTGVDIETCDDENSRPTTLLPGARIYDRAGNLLSPEAIQQGVVNVVDGFMTGDGLMAFLVIVEPSDDEAAERVQLSGTIGVVDGESLTLLTDLGDRCVVFDDSSTDVFVTGLDEGGGIVFSESSVTGLAAGQRADAFGEQNSEGCLAADTLIIELE